MKGHTDKSGKFHPHNNNKISETYDGKKMRFLRVFHINCDMCGKHIKTKNVELKDASKEEVKEHFCNKCNKILDYNVKKYNL